ncbi:glycosyl transferase [Mycena crocata]|nr:glycosyl transferase [Mycena crocata]
MGGHQAAQGALAHHVQTTLGLTINTNAMFDVQIKRLHEYKRQTLNILGVIHRYLTLKNMSVEEKKKVNPASFSSSRARCPGVLHRQAHDPPHRERRACHQRGPDTKTWSLYFLPDYSVSRAEVLIPASDISQHISTPFCCLNGGLLLGTVDGANIEIAEEVGENNSFGHLTPAVEDLRYQHTYHTPSRSRRSLSAGLFGDDSHVYEPLLNTIRQGDHYLLSDDFDSYIAALAMVDEAYLDRTEWVKKSIRTSAKMGKFSSDRAINEYAESYWNIEALPVV